MELQVLVLRPIFFFFFFVFLTILQQSSSARVLTITKPDRHDYAASARWLVSQNSWGVLRYLILVSFCLSCFSSLDDSFCSTLNY